MSMLIIASLLIVMFVVFVIISLLELNVRHMKNEIISENRKSKCCPICGNDTFIDYCYTLMICTKCKGLIDYTPFGLKVTSVDASVRFPEINEWWDKRYEMNKIKIGGDNLLI